MQNLFDSRNNIKEDDGGEQRKSGTKVLSKTTIPKSRNNNSCPKIDHSKDKELINSGLHRLVSSFNASKVGLKPSKTLTNKKEKLSVTSSSIIPDRPEISHIALNKQISIDKYTMTEFEEKEEKLDLHGSPLNEQPYRDLQWTDPRLLRKYSLVQPFKKSMTIPFVNKSEYGSEVEAASDDDADLLYGENKHFLFKCLYYLCTTSVSFIGSMCGITLITVVLWKMLDENIFVFSETPKNDLFLRTIIRGIMGLAFNLINGMLERVMRLLTISTSEAFAPEEDLSWYHKLF